MFFSCSIFSKHNRFHLNNKKSIIMNKIIHRMFQLMNNNQTNNGNNLVVTVEMQIEVEVIMDLPIEIIIVAVLRIITINNIGEDHVSFIFETIIDI